MRFWLLPVAVAGLVLSPATEHSWHAHRRPQTPPANSAALSGVVVSDARDNSSLGRAVVWLSSADSRTRRTVIADDEGRFAFDHLPAGRYNLEAAKAGYVDTAFGARLPGRRGVPLVLSDGEHRAGLALRVFRGGVISGMVRDPFGQPAVHQYMAVLQHRLTPDGWRFEPVSVGSAAEGQSGAWTDDRGVYRLYGLAPGTYLVVARTPPSRLPPRFRETTAQDVQAALRLLRNPLDTAGTDSGVVGSPSAAVSPQPPPVNGVMAVPVYYPGALSASDATSVAIGPGEERLDINVALQFGSTSLVQGSVTDALGRPSGQAIVHVISEGDVDSAAGSTGTRTASGRFQLGPLTPGKYVIEAMIPPTTQTAWGPSTLLWAAAALQTSGSDVSGVRLVLAPALTLSGAVVLDGTRETPALRPAPRVFLTADGLPAASWFARPLSATAHNGRFTIANVVPGHYRLRAEVPAGEQGNRLWSVARITAAGRDVSDDLLEIRAGDRSPDIVVVLSDQGTELAGVVRDPTGRPVTAYTMIASAVDRGKWYWQSRWIQAAHLASDGSFVIRDLPPGDYLLAALTDVGPNEWFDRDLLEQASSSAVRVHLSAGERTIRNLEAGGSRRQP
jgi:Carboxypeptidase regulatory-like domain